MGESCRSNVGPMKNDNSKKKNQCKKNGRKKEGRKWALMRKKKTEAKEKRQKKNQKSKGNAPWRRKQERALIGSSRVSTETGFSSA